MRPFYVLAYVVRADDGSWRTVAYVKRNLRLTLHAHAARRFAGPYDAQTTGLTLRATRAVRVRPFERSANIAARVKAALGLARLVVVRFDALGQAMNDLSLTTRDFLPL